MNIWLPNVDEEWRDLVYPYLAFCYKMKFQKREWTGYKELESLGLDADWLISLGILYMSTQTGSYRFVEDNIMKLVKIYSIDEPEEYYTCDDMWIYEYKDWFAQNPAGGWTFTNIPKNVDVPKWMVNQVIAEILEGKYDGYILNSHYFDFDVVLYECLSEKRKLSFLSRVSKCRTFQVLDADAQSILNDYAMKDIKDSIRKGTYINQPDYLKDWFSDRIKENNRLMKYYSSYLRL